MKFRWFITKKMLVVLIGLLVAMMFWMALTGCIPVTIRPQFDDENKPIAIPVTPTGSISADGTLTPIYPVSSKAPTGTNWTGVILTVSAIANAVLMAYGINLRGALGKVATVARIGMELADANAVAETDEEVKRNKDAALQKQLKANVHKLTQELRGKT